MVRKLVVAAAIVAVGTLSTRPPADAALVTVSAAVASSATITANTDVAETTWTGGAVVLSPFTVTVTSNDAAGYEFTFTGGNTAAVGGPFTADGTAVPANGVVYTVTGTNGEAAAYANATLGATPVSVGAPAAGVVSNFDINWPVVANEPADTYIDNLTVTVTPV